MLGLAFAIVAEGFKDKTDRAGQPYIEHCIRVMYNLHTKDAERKCIALLHDAVEEKIIYNGEVVTIEYLIRLEFSIRVTTAVDLLTHKDGVPYDDYVKGLVHNEDARLCKIGDLIDNSDITRLKGLRKKDIDRMEKYHRSYIYLDGV